LILLVAGLKKEELWESCYERGRSQDRVKQRAWENYFCSSVADDFIVARLQVKTRVKGIAETKKRNKILDVRLS